MAGLWSSLVDEYRDIMDNRSDPRVKNWFMMSSPFPTMFICLFYVYFAKVLGPKLMANRKPFNLKKVLLVYNLINMVISIDLFYKSMIYGWYGKYSFVCQPVDYSDSYDAVQMAEGCWLYYMTKFLDLSDTVFFILRKKNNQVTTLHVIHHGIMPMSVWIGVKFIPGGHSTFFGMLNTFVHIWMYLYYFLAALGPAIQPYLWWKKYLTSLQLIQFVLVIIHEAQLLFVECNYPKGIVWYIGIHALLFLFLFIDFYRNAYTKKSEKGTDLKTKVDPGREGIRQSDLWMGNYNTVAYNRRLQEAKKQQENSPLYADDCKMATGYISDEGLRNRVFIDNNNGVNK